MMEDWQLAELVVFLNSFADLQKPQVELDGKACATVGQNSPMALYNTLFSQILTICQEQKEYDPNMVKALTQEYDQNMVKALIRSHSNRMVTAPLLDHADHSHKFQLILMMIFSV